MGMRNYESWGNMSIYELLILINYRFTYNLFLKSQICSYIFSCVFKGVVSYLTLSNAYIISNVLGRLSCEKITSLLNTENSLHLMLM